MSESRGFSLESLTAQGLGWIDEDTHSLIPPLYPSTTFVRHPDLTYQHGRSYTRADNPTYAQVHALLTALEGGQDSQLFSSGMAAVVSVFQALRPGDHVILPNDVYYGVRQWITAHASAWGLTYDFVSNEIPALAAAWKPGQTKIVWIETPSNPNWQITDIRAFSQEAHRRGAMVVVDNTVATPVLTRPIELGADMVMHSCTKYLNGHGDILAGALVTKEQTPLWQRIRQIAHDAGGIPGSFEAWLLLRGVRTLFVRMDRICKNAQTVAEYLDHHPRVKLVLYPGLEKNSGYEVARRQMKGGFGGMLSVRLHGRREEAVRVQASVKLFRRATSFGTTESLIEHRASYEGPQTLVPDDLLRLSIGIENPSDLIADLQQALDHG